MGLSAVTLALAKKFTKDTVIGLGAIKGAPCEIASVSDNNGSHTINLAWEDKNGITHSDSLILKDGESPYEIAVRNGFEGTEAEWLDSLKGGPNPTDIDWSSAEPEDDEPSEMTDIVW